MNTNINKDNHYFVKMRPIINYGFVSLTRSSDPDVWVECIIVEDRYKLEDGYKVTLKALDERFGTDNFYQSDFRSLLKDGYILEKTNESQHVEFIKWFEPITNTVSVVHEAYVVV